MYGQKMFSWNPSKAIINFEKHNVSFEEATSIFLDSEGIDFDDPKHSQTEKRNKTLIERKKIDLKKFILLSFPIINPNSVILNLIQDPRGVVFEPLRH